MTDLNPLMPLEVLPHKLKQLTMGKLALADIKQVVQLQEEGVSEYPWLAVEDVELSSDEATQLRFMQSKLTHEPTHLLNEATIWSRAIYPLLLLAEQGDIRAWSEVPLAAEYPTFQVSGVADGVLGKTLAGRMVAPYLVMVEAKRGLGGEDPIPQLYGQLLAAAQINQAAQAQETQQLFGCYTIADNWTFVKAIVSELDSERPVLAVQYSQEFSERFESVAILKLLKRMVQRRPT
ncbi:hypothetical protein [Stenomitos frigidus]|uniref:Uncharacterized protein n=1 Tax=Stenomitos frigidus ULC18 TaxID=2107698 RepID=A0A2T1EFM8_9CYAN|nr:hypothetical protein [Stenomitos frigidus]PSB31503.1 hypothetical protein C7B82_07395 [Stenomitos frigidus ULC18]